MRKMKAAKRMKLSEQTVTARQTKADCHLKEAALASAPVRGRPRVQVPSSNPAAAGSKQAEIPFTREQGARLKEENDALRDQLNTIGAENTSLKSKLATFTHAFQWPHYERTTWFNVSSDTRGAMADGVVRMILLMWCAIIIPPIPKR